MQCEKGLCCYAKVFFYVKKGAVQKVMSVALIELVEMTATLNVVVSINSTTVVQTYWTAPWLAANAVLYRKKYEIRTIIQIRKQQTCKNRKRRSLQYRNNHLRNQF